MHRRGQDSQVGGNGHGLIVRGVDAVAHAGHVVAGGEHRHAEISHILFPAGQGAQLTAGGHNAVCIQKIQRIIIDMGKGVRTTSAALKELGLNISDCAGILVTHEHSDHVKGLATFLKKNPLPVYGADDTLDFLDANGIVPASCELRTLSGGVWMR